MAEGGKPAAVDPEEVAKVTDAVRQGRGQRVRAPVAGPSGQQEQGIFNRAPQNNHHPAAVPQQRNRENIMNFHFDLAELRPQPYQRRTGKWDDKYDMRDERAPPPHETIREDPSADFQRMTSLCLAYPIRAASFPVEVTDDGGVRLRRLKEGTGPQDVVVEGTRVWIHYDMYTIDEQSMNMKLLDSTSNHGLATSLEIGREGIPGLQLAVRHMAVGEVAEIAISPRYGYGVYGVVGFVEVNTHLRMVVELLKAKQGHIPPYPLLSENDKMEYVQYAPVTDILMELDDLMEAGTTKFKARFIEDASDRFDWAVELIEAITAAGRVNPSTVQKVEEQKFRALTNLALYCIRKEYWAEAEMQCEKALALNHHVHDLLPKTYYRLAKAQYMQRKWRRAQRNTEFGMRLSDWAQREYRELLRLIRVGCLAEKLEREQKRLAKQKQQREAAAAAKEKEEQDSQEQPEAEAKDKDVAAEEQPKQKEEEEEPQGAAGEEEESQGAAGEEGAISEEDNKKEEEEKAEDDK